MRKLLSPILSAVCILIVLELGCRLYLFSKIPSVYKPSGFFEQIKLFLSGGSYVCEFRGSRYLFKKPKDVFRIIALGGSTTEGIRSDEETWPFMLNEKLNQPGKTNTKYEVINLGQCGAASAQEYYYLINNYYLSPDLVIVYDGYNDLSYANARPAVYILNTKKTYDFIEKKKNITAFKHFLYSNSALINRIHVYLYRLKNFINAFIIKNRLFGLGEQNQIRLFRNVEWYLYHPELEFELERKSDIDTTTVKKKLESKELSETEYRIAKSIIGENNEKIRSAIFLEKLIEYNTDAPAKKHILQSLGMDRMKLKIGDSYLSYDILEITGCTSLDKDLLPEIFKYNLENIAAFLKSHNIRGLFISQPFLPEKIMRLKTTIESENLKGLSNFDIEAQEHFAKQNPLRKKIMKTVADKYGLLFFDAQTVFDKYDTREVYLDCCHNTDYGLDIIAQQIYEYLTENNAI